MHKINLVTVVGHNITMLPHMLNHYKDIVDEVYVVVYRQHEDDGIVDEIKKLGITPYKIVTEPKFNWEKVTELYNEVKKTKPNEWWVVSDDDEFHVYPKPLQEMINDCEENGWEFITGGFIDRIGEDGTFPKVYNKTNIWKKFPYGGFFRYPLSQACPNKCCVMKGRVKVTHGQHYGIIKDKHIWGKENLNHPLRYPPGRGEGFIQVHHFKWDSTVLERLKEVSETKKEYTFWEEYQKMYDAIKDSDWKINISNKEFFMERLHQNPSKHWEYSKWNRLLKKIIAV
tara:strand:- start:425 stop:1279 length:855 start_codon:yes stop_codon:yes gene_type:complete